MRTPRWSVLVPVAVVGALLVGPMAGVATAALSVTAVSPATSGPFNAATRPTSVSVTFNEPVNSPTAIARPSSITLKLNGAGSDLCGTKSQPTTSTLACAVASTPLADGSYTVAYTGQPSPPSIDSSISGSFTFTVDTTPPSRVSTTPTSTHPVQSPSTVAASYNEALSSGSTIVVHTPGGATVSGTSAFSGDTLTFTPTAPPLSTEGVWTVHDTSVDNAGNSSSDSWTFTVDNTAPATPTITLPTFINIANKAAVPVQGTASESTGTILITATDNNGNVTKSVPLSSTNWSTTMDLTSLADGPITATATEADLAGNTSAASPPANATKDTIAPATPTLTLTPANVNAAHTSVVISGTTENSAGVSATITDGSHTTAPVTGSADATSGQYSLAPIDTSALSDGTVTATVTATDAAGNTATNSIATTKDTIPPSTPTLTVPPFANIANAAAFPASGSTDATATSVTLTASDGTPADDVTTSVTPNGSHNYSATLNLTGLSDGPITITATAVDSSANPSTPMTSPVTKDTVAPNAPTYTAAPYINNGNKTAYTQTGTAEPNSAVTFVVTDSGSAHTVSKTINADSAGAWSTGALNLTALNDGALSMTATASDAAGNASTPNQQSSTKDTVTPSTPTNVAATPSADFTQLNVTGNGTTGDTANIAITSDGTDGSCAQVTATAPISSGAFNANDVDVSCLPDGTLTTVVTQTSPAGNTSPAASGVPSTKDTTPLTVVATAPTNNGFVQNATTLSGTFSEQLLLTRGTGANTDHSTVTLKDAGNQVLATSTPVLSPNKMGISVTPTDNPLPEGSYTAVFHVLDNTTETLNTTVHFTVDRTAPTPPTATLSNATATNVSAVPITGTASEPTGSINVTVSDGTPAHNVTNTVALTGSTWSTTVNLHGLGDGAISATVTETDLAGNTSSPTTTNASKDTAVPAAPSASFSGPVSIATHTVTLSGSGEPGDTVSISVDDTDPGTAPVLASPTVAGDGSWSTPIDLSTLTDGTLTAAVTQADGVGNVSPTTQSTTTKDTVAPPPPGVTATGPANATNAAAVPFSGHGTSGDTVAISVSDGVHNAVTATAPITGGSWTRTLDLSSLNDGNALAVSVTELDEVGNPSTPTTTSMLKDTVAPPAPTASFSGPANIADNSVTLSGTGEPGDTVSISVDDTDANTPPVIMNANVAGDGTWSKTVNLSSLTDGTLTATITQTDPAGNTGPATTATTSKDTVAPPAPTGTFSGPVSIADPSVTLSGTGEPGDAMSISVDDTDPSTAPVTATATVGGDGTWSKTVNLSSLTDGTLTATITQTDSAGNTSPAAHATASKDTTAPPAPGIHAPGPVNIGNQTRVALTGTGLSGDTVHIAVTDGTKTVSADAAVSSGAWSTALDLSSLADGTLPVRVTETDNVGNTSTATQSTALKDTVAPTVRLTAPTAAFTTGSATANWSGQDTGTGIANYILRVRRAPYNGNYGAFSAPASWRNLTTTHLTFTPAAGYTTCVSVAGRDAAGNYSSWSAERCVAAPINDNAMTRSTGWTQHRNSAGYYQHDYTQTTRRGATLSKGAAVIDRIELLATTCSNCGSVSVYVGTHLVGSANLRSARTHNSVTLTFPKFALRTGAVTVKVTSAGKLVRIDGVGLSRA